uniref:E3 ubiquitin-protein ligase listerin n=1 Tax=Denticeps clupeoides TaxID=299321 RepID=A0AAY4AGR4_9TELE
MGGKNKQRTKGNVRPSSSGRAAELLARDGAGVPGFVGFGASTSGDPGYVPAIHGAEEIDNLVDADFRLVLRKLSKRDSVTKLKAVQEFGTMCHERDSDTVKGVLPYWPRIYCKISMDHDRRVREATHQAFEQLILKVRRNLAPYLKSIMGHWLIAQCDTYSPAASAANVAFQAAFPLNKQPEALSFCKDEILTVLQDNLLKETADTLSDPQTVPVEEREAKYVRLLTSSLLALKRLLTHLPHQERESLRERLGQLIAPGKFWKYSKHKTPQVRGAYFEVLASLCEHVPELAQGEASRVCVAVLLSIDDTDPVVLPPLWEAVLHVLSSITDCWSHVNAQKGVLPKLWVLLKEGGKGLATALHPNLLPFISKLPDEVTQPAFNFYSTFFTSLVLGLSSERALSSPSESAAIICATMECLRFCMLQNSGEDEEQKCIQNMLITDQLLPLVGRALGSSHLQAGPLFFQVVDMLGSWEKRAGEKDLFCRLLADFWEELGRLCILHVDQEEAEQGALEGIATLLWIMQNPESAAWRQTTRKKKRELKICFSDLDGKEEKDEELQREPQNKTTFQSDDCSPLRTRHLGELVKQLAKLNMVHVRERSSARHLHFLSLLLRSFSSQEVFRVLLTPQECEGDLGLGDEALSKNMAVRFLLLKVVTWLKQDGRSDTDFVVEMVFSVLRCCGSGDEKMLILNHLTYACAEPAYMDLCQGWVKGSVLGEKLVSLAAELCEMGLRGTPTSSAPKHAHSWALISLSLSQQHNNETLIGKEYVEKIIDRLHATLSEAKGMSDAGNMEPLVSFISDVAANFFSAVRGCLLLASAEDLLFTVFQLCAQDQTVTRLSDAVLHKLRNAFFAGVHALVSFLKSEVKEAKFFLYVAVWVKNQLINSPLGLKSLEVLVEAVQKLVETVGMAQPGDPSLMWRFINSLTPTGEEWTKIRQSLPPQWVKSPLLSGRLRITCDCPCADVWKFRMPARLPAHLCVCALLGQVVCTALHNSDQQGADAAALLELRQTAAEILYALQWCAEMECAPPMVAEYHKMLQDWDLATKIHTQWPDGSSIIQTVFTRSMIEGSLWSLTLSRCIQTAIVTATDIKGLFGDVESFFPLSEKSVSTIQVLCPSLPREDREALVDLAIAELLNWQEEGVTSCLAILHCCLKEDTPVAEEVLSAVIATIMEWRNSKEEWFLFSSHLGNVSVGELMLSVEMMRFFCWLLSHSSAVLQGAQWDLLLCSMLAWLETASDNLPVFWNPWVQLFVCVNCELIVRLSEFFMAPPSDVVGTLPAELCTEWQEFFVEGIHSLLLPLLVRIPDEFTDPDDPLFPVPVLRSVGKALMYIPVQQLTNNKLPARFVAGQKSNLPAALQTLLNTLSPLLLFRARPLQLAAYHVLNKVMTGLPECDGESDSSRAEEDDGEEPSLSPPAALMTILTATEELLENILGGVPVGEFAVVQPLSVEHCCILGYLLSWKLLLTFFKASPSHLRVQYSSHLKKSRSLHKLLLYLFRLMPENPTLHCQGAEAPSKETKTFFTETLSPSFCNTDAVQWEVPHLACSVYYCTLKDLPAMVRLWWNSQEKRVSSAVDRFTSRYVSSVLSSQEIASVQSSTHSFENMTVKARCASREVIATYSVDDVFIELVIQLPQNYPLGCITVESGRRVGVAMQQWRNWMLQLSTYLTHQNGSIMEGLALWKNNVDKRFEGVEDCMICFSVIHGSNYSLPKKACHTCKKKFHSACLYKWFTSSNKSTCPLCRETFF